MLIFTMDKTLPPLSRMSVRKWQDSKARVLNNHYNISKDRTAEINTDKEYQELLKIVEKKNSTPIRQKN